MRIREDGKHGHRTDTIEQAAEFWECNKTTALLRSADFSKRIDKRIQKLLKKDDLTIEQKQEIATILSIPGIYQISVEERISVDLED
ncbi:DUF7692 domain-containing protein [Halosimplex sp. J119]